MKELLTQHEEVFSNCTEADRQQLYAVLSLIPSHCEESKDFLNVFHRLNLPERLQQQSLVSLSSDKNPPPPRPPPPSSSFIDHIHSLHMQIQRSTQRRWLIITLIVLPFPPSSTCSLHPTRYLFVCSHLLSFSFSLYAFFTCFNRNVLYVNRMSWVPTLLKYFFDVQVQSNTISNLFKCSLSLLSVDHSLSL
jgi:hypothetical protein